MSETIVPYRETVANVLKHFNADATRGLSANDARARLAQYGANELPHAPPPPAWRKFLAQFQNPLTGLLLAATVISFVAWIIERESSVPYETLTILAIVLMNAVLGFIQENRAEQAVAALQAMSAPTARVWRDGAPQTIPASQVVPGDILLLEEGDTLAADARVLESIALRVAESALTGESSPVSKDSEEIPEEAGIGDQSNMVFSGTAIASGRGRAVVIATGAQTQIGKIAGTLQEQKEEPTPLQKELDNVGSLLGKIVIAIALIMGVTLLLANAQTRSFNQFVDILLLAVSLAVAAVPEGLTAITTIVLSLGMSRMAKRNVIVRKLSAVETLGSTTVICTDKTGTLTKNEMTVRAVVTPLGEVEITGIGYEPVGEFAQGDVKVTDDALLAQVSRTLRFAALANNARLVEQDGQWIVQGDPTEGALLVAAYKAGIAPQDLVQRFTRIGEVPFSSERKMMSAVIVDAEHRERIAVASKGAPDILLSRCAHERVGEEIRALTAERRAEIQRDIDALARRALRTLGIAYRYLDRDTVTGKITEEQEQALTWLGAVGMIDPPREEAKEAVRLAHNAGVRSIMITGDHPTTAAAIANELGIVSVGNADVGNADVGNADVGNARRSVPVRRAGNETAFVPYGVAGNETAFVPYGVAGNETAFVPYVVTGMELSKMDESRLRRVVESVAVFARVAPEHKLRIVRALKANGAIAAMTGDGVNDAPALKAADIGIAMGITGTDVSKGAADMILTDDNFASIVAAVEEGRAIFSNIQKFLRYLLSSNIGEVLVMFVGVVFGYSIGLMPEEGSAILVPLLATQILWINLLTDSGPALALGVDPPDPDVMKKPPRDPQSRVISRWMWFDILFVGVIMMFGTLAVMDASLPGGLIPAARGTMRYAQTMAFTTLVFFQLFNAFNARSDELSAFTGLFKNKVLWLAVGISVALQVLVVYVPVLQEAFGTQPLTLNDWLVCIGVASSVLWLRELVKVWQRRQK